MMGITPEMGDIKPHWGVYFTVKDVDESAKEAVKLGGKICVPPTDIPTVGRFCGISSPQGVMFYVIKYVQPDTGQPGSTGPRLPYSASPFAPSPLRVGNRRGIPTRAEITAANVQRLRR